MTIYYSFFVLFKELTGEHIKSWIYRTSVKCKKISVLKFQGCHEEVCRIAMWWSSSISFLPCPSDTAAVKVTLFATSQFLFCASVKASINVSRFSQVFISNVLVFSFNNMRPKDKNFNDCDKNCEFSESFIYFHRIKSNSSFFAAVKRSSCLNNQLKGVHLIVLENWILFWTLCSFSRFWCYRLFLKLSLFSFTLFANFLWLIGIYCDHDFNTILL